MLSKKFSFAFLDPDDIRQMIAVSALEALPRYRPEAGSLDGFLFRHARNRLINAKRDLVRRTDAPCAVCHAAATSCGDGHPDGECEVYRQWRERNAAKANIAQPRDIADISVEHEPRTKTASDTEEDAETAELLAVVDERLPVELRADLLRMRSGVPVPKVKRDVVEREVLAILAGVGLAPDDLGYRQQHRAGMRGEPGRSGETREPVVPNAA